MEINEDLIRNVVAQVLAEVGPPPKVNGQSFTGSDGVFRDVDLAVQAARSAFDQLQQRPISDREAAIQIIRDICREQAVELGTAEYEETKVGRLEHKIEKLVVLADHVPGTEFLKSDVFSGDHGLTVIERAPFGVIGAITPVTHSFPTLAANAIAMIAAGNTVVCNPHPSGKRIAAEGVRRLNRAISEKIGVSNLICVIENPSIESANQIFSHRDIALICVTGGPAVARAALKSGKRAIVAGPGNPPVVVDETADLDRAARSIIDGATYDNNLLCIGEKQIFVVESAFQAFMAAMESSGAVRLNQQEVQELTRQAIIQVGEDKHDAPAKEFLGKDASVLATAIGKSIPADCKLLFGETSIEHNPFVSSRTNDALRASSFECMDVDEAIEHGEKISEHGFRHTSDHPFPQRTQHDSRWAKSMDTTICS